MIYAILDSEGKCINRTVWDGQTEWQPPEGCTIVPDPNGQYQIESIQQDAISAEQTVEQKLNAAGLTVAELKELFGLA